MLWSEHTMSYTNEKWKWFRPPIFWPSVSEKQETKEALLLFFFSLIARCSLLPLTTQFLSSLGSIHVLFLLGPYRQCSGRFEDHKTYLWKYYSSLFTGHMQQFLFLRILQRIGHPTVDPKSWWHQWYMTLGLLIGPFGVHETYFLKNKLFFFSRSHAAFPLSCIQWNGHPTMYPKHEWRQGVYEQGAIKLDHLKSTKPIFTK